MTRLPRGLGLPPDRVELIPSGEYSQDVEREIAEGRDQTAVCGWNAEGGQASPHGCRLRAWATGNVFAGGVAKRRARNPEGAGENIRCVFWHCVLFVDCALLVFIVKQIKDEKAAWTFLLSSALHVLFCACGNPVERLWAKNTWILRGAKVYASNHASYFDVLPVMMGLGRNLSVRGERAKVNDMAVHRDIF